MKTTLTADDLKDPLAKLTAADRVFNQFYPGDPTGRQPVHTVYGGAHIFKADTAAKLGQIALQSLKAYAGDHATLREALGANTSDELSKAVYDRVQSKLNEEPVEDFRIDFEDGYGNRPDAEEDGHAQQAAKEVVRGMTEGGLPPFLGIRIKPLTPELRHRSLRTLDLFLTTLAEGSAGKLPGNFVITLPKVTRPEEVAALCTVLDRVEPRLGISSGALKIELMVETPQSILAADGGCNLPRLLQAARGRSTGAHFGTYDYTALCNITAEHQHMRHDACNFAKHMMQVSLAGTGIMLSDGATNIMPVVRHRATKDGPPLSEKQLSENREMVHRAWRLHYDNTRHSLVHGYYQGWDLHPAQLPIRYAAVYGFFLESLDSGAERLKHFVNQAAQATLAGDVFDDAATGQGLLNFFLRAVNCGAVTEEEAVRKGDVSLDELRSRSFLTILNNRREKA